MASWALAQGPTGQAGRGEGAPGEAGVPGQGLARTGEPAPPRPLQPGGGGARCRAAPGGTNGARVCFPRQVNVYVLGKTFLLLARELCINAPAIGMAGPAGGGAAGRGRVLRGCQEPSEGQLLLV